MFSPPRFFWWRFTPVPLCRFSVAWQLERRAPGCSSLDSRGRGEKRPGRVGSTSGTEMKDARMRELSIVIPTLNRLDNLVPCIESIRRCTSVDYEIIVY